jgi:hypothetical protein
MDTSLPRMDLEVYDGCYANEYKLIVITAFAAKLDFDLTSVGTRIARNTAVLMFITMHIPL